MPNRMSSHLLCCNKNEAVQKNKKTRYWCYSTGWSNKAKCVLLIKISSQLLSTSTLLEPLVEPYWRDYFTTKWILLCCTNKKHLKIKSGQSERRNHPSLYGRVVMWARGETSSFSLRTLPWFGNHFIQDWHKFTSARLGCESWRTGSWYVVNIWRDENTT